MKMLSDLKILGSPWLVVLLKHLIMIFFEACLKELFDFCTEIWSSFKKEKYITQNAIYLELRTFSGDNNK